VDQVAAVKLVKIPDAAIAELQGDIKLLQGDSAIRLKIPKGMVQVEKKVAILHHFRKYTFTNMMYFRKRFYDGPIGQDAVGIFGLKYEL
jgi:hypothetical protein